eukprot:scaffold43319_cov146-Skeletonema_marinoi.AAC.1
MLISTNPAELLLQRPTFADMLLLRLFARFSSHLRAKSSLLTNPHPSTKAFFRTFNEPSCPMHSCNLLHGSNFYPYHTLPRGHSPLSSSSSRSERSEQLLPASEFLDLGVDRTDTFAPAIPSTRVSYWNDNSRYKFFCCNMPSTYMFVDKSITANNRWGNHRGGCFRVA